MTSPRRRIAALLVTAVVVAGAFVGVLPRIADLGLVRDQLGSVQLRWLFVIGALTALNIAMYAWHAMVSLPGLGFWPAVAVTQTSTAVANTVPAGAGVGMGVSYAMFNGYRFERNAIALSMTATGVTNVLVRLALPLVALPWLAVADEAPGWTWSAAQVGLVGALAMVALTYLALVRHNALEPVVRRLVRLGAVITRRDADAAAVSAAEHIARLRAQTAELLAARGWLVLSAATASAVAVYLLFLACLEATGADISAAAAFAVFATVRLGLTVPVTPGGIGIAEAGYAAALAASGVPAASAVAAVLLFRAASYLVPIPLGALCWLLWRRRRQPEAHPRISRDARARRTAG